MMQLEKSTLNILNNFVHFNNSIRIKKGSKLATCDADRNMLASANITQEFKKDFAIYDLKKFLSVISLFDKPVLEFKTDRVIVKQDNQQIGIRYAAQNSIVAPKVDELPLTKIMAEFDLPSTVFKNIMSSVAILKSSAISVVGEEGKVLIKTTQIDRKEYDSYSVVVGQTDKNFNMIILVEFIKLINTDYKVYVCNGDAPMVHFHSELVDYWLPIQHDSDLDNDD